MKDYSFFPFELSPQTATLVTSAEVKVTKQCLLDGCIHLANDFFFSDYHARPLDFIILSNARLVHGTLVLTQEDTCISSTSYQATLRTSHFVHPLRERLDGVDVHATSLTITDTIEEPCFLFNTLRANYGHWHTQSLINVAYLDSAAKLLGIKPAAFRLVNNCGFNRTEPFREESAEVFGLNRTVFFTPPENEPKSCVQFRTLVVPSTLAVPPGVAYHPFIGQYLRDTIISRLQLSSIVGRKKLFVSRHDVQGRRGLQNEQALSEQLALLGFDTVTCSQLDYRSQLALFSSASHVVSTHAGALTNLLAAPNGTRVLEIFHSQQLNPWYRNICDSVGHDYQAYVAALNEDSRLTEAEVWGRKYDVNVDTVVELVMKM